MNIGEVKRRVDAIAKAAGDGLGRDNEALHVDEDNLYLDVLRAIANGECAEPQACAREALRASEIYYSRWYA